MIASKMIDDLLMNFRRALLGILEALIAVQLDRRSEEWDDLSERLFDILVIGPLRELTPVRIESQYGAWPKEVERGSRIGVEICSNEALVWIGTIKKWENEGGPREVEWIERLVAKPGVRFMFREFNHPEKPPASLEALDFVVGEVIEGTAELLERSRICARLTDCRFFVCS